MATQEDYGLLLPLIPTETNTDTPAQLAMSGNPMVFRMQSQYAATNTGIKAFWVISPGTFLPGQFIKIVTNNFSVVLECRTSPDSNGYQFAPLSTDSLLSTMNLNYQINRSYIVSKVGASAIRIEAREVGSDYNITQILKLDDDGGSSFINPSSASGGTYPVDIDGLRMIGLLDIYSNGSWLPLVEMSQAPEDDGHVEFDVSSYLNDYIDYGQIYDYRLRVYEKYQPENRIMRYYYRDVTNVRQVIKGGHSTAAFISKRGISIYNTYAGKLISNQPDARDIYVDEFVLFPIIPIAKSGDIDWSYTVEYTDGSTVSGTITAIAEADYDEKQYYQPRFGIKLLSLDALDSSKTIRRVSVFLKNTYRLTQNITFRLQAANQLNRLFKYRSSLGVMESLHTTAQHTSGIEVEKDELSLPLNYNYAATDRQQYAETRDYTERYEASTGLYKTKDELFQVVDFLISDEVFIVEDGNSIQVYIPGDSYEILRDDDGRYFVNFEYIKSFKNRYFSK